MGKKISILHLSDLHLISRQTSGIRRFYLKKAKVPYDHGVLLALSKQINYLGNDIGAIIISGDIVHTGERENLLSAHSVLTGKSKISRRGSSQEIFFNKKNIPTYFMPGNHDRYENDITPTGSNLFERIFSEEWGRECNNHIKTNIISSEGEDLLAIICADFSLKKNEITTKPNKFGQGNVYKERLEELAEKTKKINNSVPVIWMLHYPPIPQIQLNDCKIDETLRLLNSTKLINLALLLKVNSIFCGHTHFPFVYEVKSEKGNISIYCAGTSTGGTNILDYAQQKSLETLSKRSESLNPLIKKGLETKILKQKIPSYFYIHDIDINNDNHVNLSPSIYEWDENSLLFIKKQTNTKEIMFTSE